MHNQSTINLIENYSKEEHMRLIQGNLNIDYSRLKSLSPIFSERWDADNLPYVAKSHVIDAYYSLPERPDIAFTSLWKAINNSYNSYYLKQVFGNPNCKQLTDTKSLEKVIEHIANDANVVIEDEHTIESLVGFYIGKIPDKTYRFVASYILKGMAIMDPKSNGSVSEIYALSSYKTFKNKFPEIHGVIEKTYGEKYRDICDVGIGSDKVTVQLNIANSDEEKSIALTRSLADSLKRMLNGNKVKLDNGDFSGVIELLSFQQRLYFLIFTILYSVRNNNTHGNVASRMNSEYANKESFEAAEYIFLLGHMFLSLIMYRNGDLLPSDLKLNFENI
ncbi:hypothetical protein PRUB_a0493 [Pseudoalteromonas rubra]|uniref:Uncharacterized protein n=1 Tax=Pseudoalteromonas rubra TaxID=43658 RepID=A0A8T0C601_9GAMM|nr:hypothetical protein [Pseudoalteromonas rubra]KAF7786050.1 hypothetical protein PRUB_a0493 [Pseudoalteromonas rubra]